MSLRYCKPPPLSVSPHSAHDYTPRPRCFHPTPLPNDLQSRPYCLLIFASSPAWLPGSSAEETSPGSQARSCEADIGPVFPLGLLLSCLWPLVSVDSLYPAGLTERTAGISVKSLSKFWNAVLDKTTDKLRLEVGLCSRVELISVGLCKTLLQPDDCTGMCYCRLCPRRSHLTNPSGRTTNPRNSKVRHISRTSRRIKPG